jgi:hypothetical protein
MRRQQSELSPFAELQDRGVYRAEYEGATLREHLALPPLRSASASRQAS